MITINADDVFNEVAMTTAYVGGKATTKEENVYDKVFVTDEDRDLINRFWNEACNATTQQLKDVIESILTEICYKDKDDNDIKKVVYKIALHVSKDFDLNMRNDIETSLFSFFVDYIVSKWFRFCNREECEVYATNATGAMEDAVKKVYHRKRPVKRLPRWSDEDDPVFPVVKVVK